MNRSKSKNLTRMRRAERTRAKIRGTVDKPRLSVFRSNKYTYVQLIDDAAGRTVVSASTRGIKEKKNKTALAELLGQTIADKAKKQGIKSVIFDRGRYKFHGRIKAVAESARKAGLKI